MNTFKTLLILLISILAIAISGTCQASYDTIHESKRRWDEQLNKVMNDDEGKKLVLTEKDKYRSIVTYLQKNKVSNELIYALMVYIFDYNFGLKQEVKNLGILPETLNKELIKEHNQHLDDIYNRLVNSKPKTDTKPNLNPYSDDNNSDKYLNIFNATEKNIIHELLKRQEDKLAVIAQYFRKNKVPEEIVTVAIEILQDNCSITDELNKENDVIKRLRKKIAFIESIEYSLLHIQ